MLSKRSGNAFRKISEDMRPSDKNESEHLVADSGSEGFDNRN